MQGVLRLHHHLKMEGERDISGTSQAPSAYIPPAGIAPSYMCALFTPIDEAKCDIDILEWLYYTL